MKKIKIILLGSLLFNVFNNAQAQIKNAAYIVKGTIKGIREGTVKLVGYNEDDRTSATIDSAIF